MFYTNTITIIERQINGEKTNMHLCLIVRSNCSRGKRGNCFVLLETIFLFKKKKKVENK